MVGLILPLENYTRTNVTQASIQAAFSPLHVKVKFFTELLLSWAFFAVKLPKALTICLLKGSLFPLTGLLNEHFRPITADVKILESTVKKSAKQTESPQRSIIRYLLGAIGLTIGVAAIIYSVKRFVVSGDNSTVLDPLKPLLPPPPASSSAPVMTSSSTNMTGSWLPYALGSGLFLLGLTNYCLNNWSNVSDPIPDVIAPEIPEGLGMEAVVTPEDVLKQALACIRSGDCIDLELEDAYRILVTEGKRCADEVSSFCQAVKNSAVPILAHLQKPHVAYLYASRCLNKHNEPCQQMIDHFIPELLNALKSRDLKTHDQSIETQFIRSLDCFETYRSIAVFAYDACRGLQDIDQSTLSFLAKTPTLLLSDPCPTYPDPLYFVESGLKVIDKVLQKAPLSPALVEDAQTIGQKIETLVKTFCNQSTGSIGNCELMLKVTNVSLIDACNLSQNPICNDIITEKLKQALRTGHSYLDSASNWRWLKWW